MIDIYIPDMDNIYFQKTSEYFQEVISSYANGNYRSAIVMMSQEGNRQVKCEINHYNLNLF